MNRFTYLTLILSLGLLTGIEPFTIDMTLPAVPAIAASLGSTGGEIQISLGMFVLGLAVGQLVYGPLADRFGRKPVLLAGLGAYIAISMACAGAGDVEAIQILRLFQGMAAAVGQSLVRTIIRDHYQRDAAARLFSFVMIILASAPIIAPFLGSWITGNFGWRWLFWFFALYGLLNLGVVFCLYRESIPARNPDALVLSGMLGNFRTILSTRSFVAYALCLISAFCGLFAFLSGVPLVLIGGSGLSLTEFSRCFAAVMIPHAAALLAGGLLVGRVGMDRLLRIGVVAGAVSGTVMLLWTLHEGQPVLAIVLPAAMYMAAFSFIVPNATAGAISPFPQMAGTASSLIGFLQFGTASVVAASIGWFPDGTGRIMAIAITASALTGIPGLLLLRKRNPALPE